ncbi:MAG: ABC transporter ATP-binding protein [Bacteroidales bacterium]|nr:ABC transporter ATP-binding protein [Bacteroidales bacterium]
MIDVSNLTCRFGQQTVLQGLNLHIERGSFYALLGPNGCGKTTLLRCLAGLLAPQEGSIALDGKPLNDYTIRQRAQRLSLVRQQQSTDLDFSAFEIVLMGRNPYQRRLQNESKADWDIVERCMKQTGTWHLRFAHPNEMSGGELQRVMIARALAQTTPLMLLDEPTSNLDIAHQLAIMRFLGQINRLEGKTIIVVVHDLNLALQYCPQAVLLHEGQVYAQGPTPSILSPDNIATLYHVQASHHAGHLHFQ